MNPYPPSSSPRGPGFPSGLFAGKTLAGKKGERVMRWTALTYIGLLVVLPILAISGETVKSGFRTILADLSRPEALASLKLTFLLAFTMILITSCMGTLTAWVMVRYPFRGKAVVNALIDLPFAIPTVVTGLMLVVLYGPASAIGSFMNRNGVEVIYAKPGIVLALLYVTFPFVVRAVQPVLMEMNMEMEEAAACLGAGKWTIFKRIVFPSLLPSILTGAAQAFSKALGEFGSVVIVAGNIPMKTQIAPVYIYGEIESYNPSGALAVSLVLLAGSMIVLLLLNVARRVGTRYGA
ncbi:sulfate ABC transporter permease subunit CysT [bacterium]|nr:sulfate ABC transporter permease subunit CysT [candidate division CSSED10-310 bacterium]